ncbi:MAG TPA: sulfate ABC transporter permease subunit CysT [Eoetvoesiella sp.]
MQVALPLTVVKNKAFRVLPGFNLSLGFTLLYLSLIVLLPLSAVFLKTFTMTWDAFISTVTSDRLMASYRLTFGASLLAAAINVVFGGVVAWVLVRYTFPGKKIIDALVDLPFALPTAVAGIALTALYAPNGWIGQYLEPLGIKVAFTSLGVLVALTFIALPFVVRTVQPVLEEAERGLIGNQTYSDHSGHCRATKRKKQPWSWAPRAGKRSGR